MCGVFSSSAVERRCAFSGRSPHVPCPISIPLTATTIPTMVVGVPIPMCCHGKTQCQKRVHRPTMRAFPQNTAVRRLKRYSEVMKAGAPEQTGAALLAKQENGKMLIELGRLMVSQQREALEKLPAPTVALLPCHSLTARVHLLQLWDPTALRLGMVHQQERVAQRSGPQRRVGVCVAASRRHLTAMMTRAATGLHQAAARCHGAKPADNPHL